MDAASAADLETLAGRLREAGLRVTGPRLSVLALLEHREGHHSVDELVARLREEGDPLPRATVYNVVADLAEAGIIMAADAGPGPALYEAGGVWHHHFVCRSCDKVVDVPCQNGDRPCLEAELPGARVEEAQVIFRGRCPSCA